MPAAPRLGSLGAGIHPAPSVDHAQDDLDSHFHMRRALVVNAIGEQRMRGVLAYETADVLDDVASARLARNREAPFVTANGRTVE